MTPRECCEAAEGGLAQAARAFLHPSPDSLDECLQVLSQTVDVLERLALDASRDADPALALSLARVQAAARRLAIQVEHGSALVRGWMQMHFGEGYTRGGSPAFSAPDAQRQVQVEV